MDSANNSDAFPGESKMDCDHRLNSWLAAQRCANREGDGVHGAQCELSADHEGSCACPQALKLWMTKRYGVQ